MNYKYFNNEEQLKRWLDFTIQHHHRQTNHANYYYSPEKIHEILPLIHEFFDMIVGYKTRRFSLRNLYMNKIQNTTYTVDLRTHKYIKILRMFVDLGLLNKINNRRRGNQYVRTFRLKDSKKVRDSLEQMAVDFYGQNE
jgi:hypothetical protein